MIIKHSSLILVASLIMAGCSSTVLQSSREKYSDAFLAPAQANQVLAKKQACCENFSLLQYQEINSDDDLIIPLTSDSQVYSFSSGKSFVQAYKLTTKGTKLKLNIDSLIYNTALAPQVTLLDANFNITRTISADKFIYKEPRLLKGDTLSAEITIFRAQANNLANETYPLFYTTDKAMIDSTTIVHPAKSYAKAHRTVEPNIADPIIPHSAMGLIKLEIEKEGSEDDAENSYIPVAIADKGTEAPVLTEKEFNQEIQKAVEEKEIDKALTIVDQAEAAGSQTARETFVNALNKPTDNAEIEFNNAILEAVATKDIDKALTIVEEAEAAGSQTARETFINAVKNND